MNIYLLDADVIIWCAENSKLDALFKGKRIRIPQKICDEVIYMKDPGTGATSGIDLSKYIADGLLEIVDCDVSQSIREIRSTYRGCPQLAEIDDGEIECIALLRKEPECHFCTGDINAMKVVGYWGLSDQAISLEEVLGRVRDLRYDFTNSCLRKNLKIGSSLRAQYFKYK